MNHNHKLTLDELNNVSGGIYEASPNVYLYSEQELSSIVGMFVNIYRNDQGTYVFVNTGIVFFPEGDGKYFALNGNTKYKYGDWFFGPLDGEYARP